MLSEEEKQAYSGVFAEISAAQTVTVEDVIEAFESQLELLEKIPANANRSRQFLLSRARAGLDRYFANKPKKGDPFVFAYFGKLGKAKDWNEGERATIKDDLDDNKMPELIKSGKLMTLNGKPVSRIDKMEVQKAWISNGVVVHEAPEKDGIEIEETIVTAGKEWEAGEHPIYRDSRLFNSFDNSPNKFGYSKILGHQYELTIVGIAWRHSTKEDERKAFEADKRLFVKKIGYDQADPESENYFLKNYEAFTPYIDNFVLDEATEKTTKPLAKTQPWQFVFKGKSSVSAKAYDMDTSEFDITINETLEKLYKAYSAVTFIPRVYSLNEIKDAHFTCVKKDKDGNVLKSEKGYDQMEWDRYFFLQAAVSINTNKEGKGYQYILNDASHKDGVRAFHGDAIFKQPKFLPGSCLMMVNTKRDMNRYDVKLKQKVFDAANPDIQLTVQSIVSIVGGDKIEISEVGY